MKYVILIADGAAGGPLKEAGGKTSLELASTPNLDALAREGLVGLARTVPAGMEPSSACACMSVLGYDPRVYFRGRSAIEARSMGVPVLPGEVVFRCNMVTVLDGKMADYSAGHITSEEAHELITALAERLGNDGLQFFPGVAYRHLCKLVGHEETLQAICTPPHDIPGQPVAAYMPNGQGSGFLREVMELSQEVLREHPVNIARRSRGQLPATMVWLFWGAGQIPEMPPFRSLYSLDAGMTSAVDLLRGLASMAGIETLELPGVSDGPDNDYAAQAQGALRALDRLDMVVMHVEPPDEAGHQGSIPEKVKAIEMIDREMVARVRALGRDNVRFLVMPDHPTPIEVRTHVGDPVPFLAWGAGLPINGAGRFTEAAARSTGLLVEEGHTLMARLVTGWATAG
ncbi:MAG: cofactor-independent phosphoglycerate mutase [Chloroflexi bacterium]|nr:cofactor-independent phosphoglycerate mutase [Chloroflexota bacterium]